MNTSAFKVGDYIYAYHKGIHQIYKIECDILFYEKRYKDNLTLAKKIKNHCSSDWCSKVLLEDLKAEKEKMIANFDNIIREIFSTTEVPLLYTTLNIEEDCDIKCPDYFYGSSFPPYVYATEGDYKVALKRIAENTYYRDSGAWKVDAIKKENGEMFTVSEISSINNLKLVACTHKEYKRDNRGYV